METSRTARNFSSRFVAGHTLEEGLAVCRALQAEGMTATLDYLGENVASLEDAAACREVYLRMVQAMHEAGVEPNVSLKLTQFGLELSESACEENVAALVRAAAAVGGFVYIDMESSAYTDRTLGIVTRLHRTYGACGTVLQAYLRRSGRDAEALVGGQVPVRLCKGAYLEPPESAFPEKKDVDANYLALAKRLLESGTRPAIATHDWKLIEAVEGFAAGHGIARDRFEFQMLYGIRRDEQRRLVREGYRLRLYVPFGDAWYPYFMRRLAERPANLFFFLRYALAR